VRDTCSVRLARLYVTEHFRSDADVRPAAWLVGRPGELVWVSQGVWGGYSLGFPSGRLISSNMATWVLSSQDSSVSPQTVQSA
jgi:hypothetical protein